MRHSLASMALISSLAVLTMCSSFFVLAHQRVPTVSRDLVCEITVESRPVTGDVVVTWAGGKAPFGVLRGNRASFDDSTKIELIAEGLCLTKFIDRQALKSGERYWYMVKGADSPPMVLSIRTGESTKPEREVFKGRGAENPAACADERESDKGGSAHEPAKDAPRACEEPVDSAKTW